MLSTQAGRLMNPEIARWWTRDTGDSNGTAESRGGGSGDGDGVTLTSESLRGNSRGFGPRTRFWARRTPRAGLCDYSTTSCTPQILELQVLSPCVLPLAGSGAWGMNFSWLCARRIATGASMSKHGKSMSVSTWLVSLKKRKTRTGTRQTSESSPQHSLVPRLLSLSRCGHGKPTSLHSEESTYSLPTVYLQSTYSLLTALALKRSSRVHLWSLLSHSMGQQGGGHNAATNQSNNSRSCTQQPQSTCVHFLYC